MDEINDTEEDFDLSLAKLVTIGLVERIWDEENRQYVYKLADGIGGN